MRLRFSLLFVGSLIVYVTVSDHAGSWLPLNSVHGINYVGGIYNKSCYNVSNGWTCYTKIPTELMSFKNGSDRCRATFPGSTLIVIKNAEDQRIFERFISEKALDNETIITDARQLTANKSRNWSWVNGHQIIPEEVKNESARSPNATGGALYLNRKGQSPAYLLRDVSSQLFFICEHSGSQLNVGSRPNNKRYFQNETVATWFEARKECRRLRGDLASITDLQTMKDSLKLKEKTPYWIGLHRNKWIWNSTGDPIVYANFEGGYSRESSDNRSCICISPKCRVETNKMKCQASHERKWNTCPCKANYTIVCQIEHSTAVTTDVALAGEMLSSKSSEYSNSTTIHPSHQNRLSSNEMTSTSTKPNAAKRNSNKSIASKPVAIKIVSTRNDPTLLPTRPIANIISTSIVTQARPIISATQTKTTITTTQAFIKIFIPTTATTDRVTAKKTAPTASIKRNTTYRLLQETSALSSAASSPTEGLFKSLETKEIILIIVLITAVAFIAAVFVVVIRKRRSERRNKGSSKNDAGQSETAASVYATVISDNRPPESMTPSASTIYADVEMSQRPKPTNNAIYACVQPSGEAVDMGRNVVYADLDLPKKDRRKPRSSDQIIVSLSPIYAQPFEPPCSTVYAEPFNPHNGSTATVPIRTLHTTVGDQQNVYSLAKSIPMDNPNAIYSEPYRPKAY